MSEIKELESMLSYYGRQINKKNTDIEQLYQVAQSKIQGIHKLKATDKVKTNKTKELEEQTKLSAQTIQDEIKPLKDRYELIESKIGKIAESKLNEFVKG